MERTGVTVRARRERGGKGIGGEGVGYEGTGRGNEVGAEMRGLRGNLGGDSETGESG